MALSDGVRAGQTQSSIFWGSNRRHAVILACPGALPGCADAHPRLPECNSRPQAGLGAQAGGFAAGGSLLLCCATPRQEQ